MKRTSPREKRKLAKLRVARGPACFWMVVGPHVPWSCQGLYGSKADAERDARKANARRASKRKGTR